MKPQKKQKRPNLPPGPPDSAVEIGSRTPERGGWMPEDRGDRFVFVTAVLGLAVVIYLLFFFEFRSRLTEANIVGKIRTDSTVRRRHAKTLHWHDVRGQDTIYLRDIVYTPRDTLAVVTFNDGKTLELKPDSMVQFDEVTSDGLQINLFDFTTFRLIPYPKTVRSTLLADPRPLELRHAEYTQRLDSRLKRGLNLERFRKLSPVSLVLDRLSDYTVILVRPENKTYNLSTSRWLQYVWTPIPLENVDFQLHISLDPQFRRFQTHRSKAYKLLVQFDSPNEYFWRIKATQGREHIYSNVGAFTFAEGKGLKKRVILNADPDKKAPSEPSPQ